MILTKENYQQYVGKQVQGFVEEDREWDGGGKLIGKCESTCRYILEAGGHYWTYDKIRVEDVRPKYVQEFAAFANGKQLVCVEVESEVLMPYEIMRTSEGWWVHCFLPMYASRDNGDDIGHYKIDPDWEDWWTEVGITEL